MKTKVSNFRLAPEAREALTQEAARTGKTQTGVVEDLLLCRRLFPDEAEFAVRTLARQHKMSPRKVIETLVLKGLGLGGKMPFNCLAVA